jgi:phospholipid/cholesterol/gamma-HCH transport system substrate-binding protein
LKMETRARYVLIGVFALAVLLAGFGFVYWLHNAGGLGERVVFQVRFNGSVPGVRVGSAVLFNGVRVGEVTDLRLDVQNPREVLATIAVERSTPVRADTTVSVESQGLMAAPSVSLKGGQQSAPPLKSSPGQPGILVADAESGQDTMQTAREVLRHVDRVVVDNAEPLRETIANLKVFTDALARNSARIDGLLEGLERMMGGGKTEPAPPAYYLSAPTLYPETPRVPAGQLAIPEPTAVLALDTQRILLWSGDSSRHTPEGAQWSDTIPKLIQSRIIQSFENAQYGRVARFSEGLPADHQLLIDIRAFWISLENAPTAQVQFGVKLMDAAGHIVASRLLSASAPAAGSDPVAAAVALNTAFQKAAVELVLWVSTSI